MTLPLEKSKKDSRFSVQKFGMIGASGIGKSDFWAQEENGLFLRAEAGLNAIEAYQVPIRGWGDLRTAYGDLVEAKKAGKLKFNLLVLDTIDRIVEYAQEEIIGRAREFYKKVEINTIADIPEGAGWSRTKELVTSFLNHLESLEMAIAFVSHLSCKPRNDDGNKYEKNTISIGGQLGESLLAWADHILHIESKLKGDKLVRIVWTRPTQTREAKSRGSIIPDGWIWDESSKVNYGKLRSLFT